MKDAAAAARKKAGRKTGMLIFLFLLPALAFYCFYGVTSVVMTFWYALQDWSGVGEMTFTGLANFRRLLADPIVYTALKNNLLIVATAMVFQIPPAMILALIINAKFRGIKLFRTVYFIPQLLSTVAVGILWILFYDPYYGMINKLLIALGLQESVRGWLGEAPLAMWCVILVICWQNIPFHMILLNAGLAGISEDIYESAKLDGATGWTCFWKITFPLMSGTIKTCCTLALVGSLRYFDLIYVMTQGGPNDATQLMATYMYKKGFLEFSMGYASSIAAGLFLVIFLFTLLLRKGLDLWKVDDSL